MVSSVLANLSWVLVLAGGILLMVSLALTRRARRHSRTLQALLHISGQNPEPLAIAGLAWPHLAQAGWRHLTVIGDWFGYPIQTVLGDAEDNVAVSGSRHLLVFQIDSGADVHLTLQFTHREDQGENRLFAEPLARVMALLLETSLRTRTQALSAALAERARLTLYLQHDMRNMAQWVSWVGMDLAACEGEADLLRMAKRLQASAPLAQERAQRLMIALGQRPVDDQPGSVDLAQAITQAAQLAGMEVEICGHAQGWIAKSLLARALDNLFSNLSTHWRATHQPRPLLHLQTVPASVATPVMAHIRFESPWLEAGKRMAPKKLFEPFASGRPGGLGLGLYQARLSLREAGGELRATVTDEGISFLLEMPAQAL